MTDFFLSSALPSVTTFFIEESLSKLFWSLVKNPLYKVLIWSYGGLFLYWLLNCLEILGFWLSDLSADISILLGRMGLKSFLASTLSDSTILGIGLPLRVLSDYIGVSSSFYLLRSARCWDRPVDFTLVLNTWWISRKEVGSFGSSVLLVFVKSRGRGALRMTF